MENLLLIIAGIAIVLAIAYAVFNYFCVKKLEEGTEKMGEIAGAIRIGANAFIKYEYKLVAVIGVAIEVVVFVGNKLASGNRLRYRRRYECFRRLGRYEDSNLRKRARNQHRAHHQGRG